MCIVTPKAIRSKITLAAKALTTKMAEYPITIHKKEIDKTFAFNGTPFLSR